MTVMAISNRLSWTLADVDLETVQVIIESVQDGVYIADPDGFYITANKAFEHITGINREDLKKKHTSFMLEKSWITAAVNLEVLKDHKSRSKVVRYPSGKDILVTASVVANEKKQIVGVVSSLRDLSELNEMQRRLLYTHNQIEEFKQKIDHLESRFKNGNFNVIAWSTESRRILFLAKKVAHSDATVLITGESGVGKEVIAKYIHESSIRKRTGKFVKVDCAALPATLLESELFGYEKGAFTDAHKEGKKGLFEQADKGTLFLDEIGAIPFELQSKLLNAIQDREIKRIGSVVPRHTDVRIIAATNVDLDRMVREHKFRDDLYYRLNVVPLRLPPLRERNGDILPLITHFLSSYNRIYNMNKYLSSEAADLLIHYIWPGNVRELKNTIERLVVMSSNDEITARDVPEEIRTRPREPQESKPAGNFKERKRVGPLKALLAKYEQELISMAMQIHGNLSDAAQDLGVDISTLTRKNRRYGLRGRNRRTDFQKNTLDKIFDIEP